MMTELQVEMDLQNLISCIECHEEEKNVDVIIETLKTIITVCSDEDCGKDAFRDVGGLDFLLDFIANTDQIAILEYGLKVLSFLVDENVHNQLHLTDPKVFKILQVIFERKSYPLTVLKNAVLLYPTILFQNRTAQELIREEGYLGSLINEYKQYVPRSATYNNSGDDPEFLEIWLNINSALCFAVNNPLNEKNQVMCSCLFPVTLTTLDTHNSVIIEASSSLLSLSIATNEKNQNAFTEYDGFLILKRCLNKNFELMLSDIKECNNIISKSLIQTTNCLIGIISAAVVDNGKNASLCGKLGIVTQMIQFLSIDVLNSSVKKKSVLVLGQCIDAFSDNKSFILDVPEFDLLLKRNLERDDTELHYATKYLLQVCLNECTEDLKENSCSFTAVSSHKNSSDEFHKRYEANINQQIKSAAKGSTKCPDNRKYQQNVHGRNKLTNLPVFQNDPLTIQEKIDLLNSISDKELNFNKMETSDKFNLNTSDLFSNNVSDSNSTLCQRGVNQNVQRHTKDHECSKCNSLDDISLQSAHHLYMMNKRRLEKIKINKLDSKDRFGSFNNKSTVLHNNGRKCNLTVSKLSKCSEVKSARFSSNDSKQNITKASHKNCSKIKHAEKNFSKEDSVNVSNLKSASVSHLKQRNNFFNIPLDSLALKHNQSINNTYASKENVNCRCSKNFYPSCTNITGQEFSYHKPVNACSSLNSSNIINCCKKDFDFSDSHSAARIEASDISNQSNKKDILKLCSINLESFPKSCLKEKTKKRLKCHLNHKSGASKMPQKTKGCVQVIALPGLLCSQHKLTSDFEMLKVCPLQNVPDIT